MESRCSDDAFGMGKGSRLGVEHLSDQQIELPESGRTERQFGSPALLAIPASRRGSLSREEAGSSEDRRDSTALRDHHLGTAGESDPWKRSVWFDRHDGSWIDSESSE